MKVHASALKHGISPEDAVHAADWSQWIEPLEEDDWPHRELRLGFDTRARLLETVVLVFERGEEMVYSRYASETQVLGPAALSAATLAAVDAHPAGDGQTVMAAGPPCRLLVPLHVASASKCV